MPDNTKALEAAKNSAVEKVYVSEKNTQNFTVTVESGRFVITEKEKE